MTFQETLITQTHCKTEEDIDENERHGKSCLCCVKKYSETIGEVDEQEQMQ